MDLPVKERIARTGLVEEASHIPVIDSPLLDGMGYAAITKHAFSENHRIKGAPSAGIRVRIPKALKGDFVLWYFATTGSSHNLSYRASVANHSISTRPLRFEYAEISSQSPFRKKYNENQDFEPVGIRISNDWLLPGEVLQVGFSRRDSSIRELGTAFRFTDGFNEMEEEYLPFHLIRPPVR